MGLRILPLMWLGAWQAVSLAVTLIIGGAVLMASAQSLTFQVLGYVFLILGLFFFLGTMCLLRKRERRDLASVETVATIASTAARNLVQIKKRSATGGLLYTGYGPDRKMHTYNRLEIDQLAPAELERLFTDFPDMRGWYYSDD